MTLISRLKFRTIQLDKIETPKKATTKDISIVIPVKNNQKGIDKYLKTFFISHVKDNFPKEIIVVDNDSVPAIKIQEEYKKYGIVKLLHCTRVGPASARNEGWKKAKGNWILFNDSDCIPSERLLLGYIEELNGAIAYAGNVKSYGTDRLSKYYESQEILIPLKIYDNNKIATPQYLITANALVWRKGLEKIGGFNENIKIASGEDIDLGLRVSQIGRLSYAFESIVYHNFDDGLKGFFRRFRRYGKGNKIIQELYQTDTKPRPFVANDNKLINNVFAKLQYLALLYGYYFD